MINDKKTANPCILQAGCRMTNQLIDEQNGKVKYLKKNYNRINSFINNKYLRLNQSQCK